MISHVKPKKFLGQHFLRDENIARKVADGLSGHCGYKYLLEVGPGTGALTKWLVSRKEFQYVVVETDEEAVAYLHTQYQAHDLRIIHKDILTLNPHDYFADHQFAVIGNFPYNISSQIIFRVLQWRHQVPELVGMFQREVADRLASKPGNKVYGILSVLVQSFYDVELLFHVSEQVFFPPPKVRSAVIRLKRKEVYQLGCDERALFQVVKMAFNQRRKMLRNALQALPVKWDRLPGHWPTARAEQLDVSDFVRITQSLHTPD